VLVYRDHFTWDGPWDEATATWYTGGRQMTGVGGLFVTGKVDLPPLGPEGPLRRAVLPLAHGDTLIRRCGPVPELTADLTTTAFQLAARWSGGAEAPPWLIGSTHLGPNHWFSTRP
jgi:hypothetical protein